MANVWFVETNFEDFINDSRSCKRENWLVLASSTWIVLSMWIYTGVLFCFTCCSIDLDVACLSCRNRLPHFYDFAFNISF